MEIWDLEVSKIGLTNIVLESARPEPNRVTAVVNVADVKMHGKFMTNAEKLKLEIAGFDVIISIKDLAINFPNEGTVQNGITASLGLNLLTKGGTTFDTEIPDWLTIPTSTCDISVGLGINLVFEDLEYLRLCAPILGCTTLIDKGENTGGLINAIANLFNIDGIVSGLVRILEGIVGGIICQPIEQSATLNPDSGLQGDSPGILNEVLDQIQVVVDEWASGQNLDPVNEDLESVMSQNGVTQLQIDNSVKFSESTVAELLAVGINDWLGAESKNPGYALVIDEFVDKLTYPAGSGEVDLIALGFAPSLEIPLKIVALTARVNKVRLSGLNTFNVFNILDNFVGTSGGARFDRTFKHNVNLSNAGFGVEMFLKFAPDPAPQGWITSGTIVEQFTFQFEMGVNDLNFGLHTLIVANPAELDELQLGQLTQISPSDAVSALQTGLNCLGPALYHFNLTTLDVSIGSIGAVKMLDFGGSGLDALITDSVELGREALKGALSTKLNGAAHGIIRETINEYLKEYITHPDVRGECPAYVPTVSGPYTIDFTSGIYELLNQSIGGNPIEDSAVDINEAIAIVLKYLAGSVDGFPIEQVDVNDNGGWKVADTYIEGLKMPAFQAPGKFIEITKVEIANLDSIYRLTADELDSVNGGIAFDLGLGGDLLGQTGPNPLSVSVDLNIAFGGTPTMLTLELGLTNIDIKFALSKLVVDIDFINDLKFKQLSDIVCILTILMEVDFADKYRSLNLDKQFGILLDVAVSQYAPSDSGAGIVDFVNQKLTEAVAYTVTAANNRFVNLLNSLMTSLLGLGLDSAEGLGNLYPNTTAATCSQDAPAVDINAYLNMIPNFTALAEECLSEPGPTVAVGVTEGAILYEDDELARYGFNFQESTAVSLFSGIVTNVLGQNGVINDLFVALRNSTGSVFKDAFTWESDGNVTMNINIGDLFGLNFDLDSLIPGLVVSAGTVKLKGINRILSGYQFAVPGAFTTRHSFSFDQNVPLDVEIHAFIEVDAKSAGEPGKGKIVEEVIFALVLDKFEFNLELTSAVDTSYIVNRTLAHYLAVNEKQEFEIAPFAGECLMSLFFENGLVIRDFDLSLDVPGQVSSQLVTVTAPNQELFNDVVLGLVEAVAVIGVDFYKDAINNICRTCLKDRANAYIKELQTGVDACPSFEELPEIPLSGTNEIFNFKTSAELGLFQQLMSKLSGSPEAVSVLNEVVNFALQSQVFLASPDDNFYSPGLPFIYGDTTFGIFDIGLGDIKMENLNFTQLNLIEPQSNYVTSTNIGFNGPFEFIGDFVVNMQNFFLDNPDVRNNFRLGFIVEGFQLDLLLELQLNLKEIFRVQFSAFSNIQEAICLVVPIKRLTVLDFNISLDSLQVSIECLDDCDKAFPFIGAASDGIVFTSSNGGEVAAVIERAMKWFAYYLEDIGTPEYLNEALSNTDATCQTVLASIEDLILPGEVDETPISAILALTFAGVSVVGMFSMFLLIPVHKRQRQKIRANHLDNIVSGMDDGSIGKGSSADVVELLNLSMHSVFQNPSTPIVAKFAVPAVLVLNVLLTCIAVFVATMLTLVIQLTLLGSATDYLPIVRFTAGGLTQDLWLKYFPPIALLLGAFLLAFPIIVNSILLLVWFLPTTLLKNAAKKKLLGQMEMAMKLGFILATLTAFLCNGLYTNFSAADYKNTDFVDADAMALFLNIRADIGATLMVLVSIFTIICIHIERFFLLKQINRLKKGGDAQNNLAGTQKSAALLADVSIVNHEFIGVDDNGQIRVIDITKVFVGFVVAGLSFVLIVVGYFVPFMQFNVSGLLGIVLEEISTNTDNPELIANPLHIRPVSFWNAGVLLGTMPSSTAGETLTIIFFQLVYFMVTLVFPLIHLVSLFALILMPMNLEKARQINYLATTLQSLAGIEIGLVAGSLACIVISPLILIYVNQVSDTLTGVGLCDALQPYLATLSGTGGRQAEDAYCMDVTGEFLVSSIVIIMGALLQIVAAMMLGTVASAAITDRYYAAYEGKRGDAKLQPLSKLSSVILNFFTATVPSQNDHIKSMFATRVSSEDSSICGACFKPVDKRENDEVVSAWNQKFKSTRSANPSSVNPGSVAVSSNPSFSFRSERSDSVDV